MIRSLPLQDLRANSQARFTPPRLWAPLTEAEWALVATQLDIVRMAGRRVADPRARVNAIFMVAVRGLPWRRVPEASGRPDTISRQFRRWARQGLWLRLLAACRAPGAPLVLHRMEYRICRVARRAMRGLGDVAANSAERLGALTAMPVLPVYRHRPENVTYVRNWMRGIITARMAEPWTAPICKLRRLLALERHFLGRPWWRRDAPP